MNRIFVALLACAALLIAADHALAKPPSDKDKGAVTQEKKAKHSHKQKNGKDLLGAKLKQDGKHNVGKLGKHDVVAEVKKGKVSKMAAGDLPVKHVKTKQKMTWLFDRPVRLASLGALQLAQYSDYDDYYYGFCFDDGYDYVCYWYSYDEVYYDEYEWDDYDPYY